MKKFAVLICALILLLTGCSSKKSNQNACRISVNTGNKEVQIKEIDVSKDNLLEKSINEDTDFDMEKKIFSALLDGKISAKMNDEVTLKFDKKYDDVIVYDHLLTKDGYSYFNRSINQYNLKVDNDTAKIKLSEHPAKALSSDSSFLETGEIRGFRIVFQDSDEKYEYAFLINIEK